MRIATWNVNSILAHEDQVLDWLETEKPDVLAMQETKCTDQAFPEDGFGDLGYDVISFGQATYNGVALATRGVAKDVHRGLSGGPLPKESRLIAATIDGVRIINVYVPNGQTLDAPQFSAKLAWLAALRTLVESEMGKHSEIVLLGDFNVAPADQDVFDPTAFVGRTHVSAPEREAFDALLRLGFADALRHFSPAGARVYTFWDYQGAAFERDLGMRIDHVLVTKAVLERARGGEVGRSARAAEKRSDHAPVLLDLA